MDEAEKIEILDRLQRAGLALPRVLTVMITNGCNLECRHCWPESQPHKAALPVAADRLKRFLGEFAGLGLEEICLTGGEPLTHPHWIDILRCCCSLPGLEWVRLQTNATLLKEPEIRALTSIEFKGLLIQVSLDGAGPSTNDPIRGPDSFERAFQGLTRLSDAGLGSRTVVAFTETRHNFMELPRLFEILHQRGIGRLVTGTLVQAGRAAETGDVDLPTPDQVRSLLNLYHSDPSFRAHYDRIGNIACLEWLKGRDNPYAGDCVCVKTPYVTPDGRMYPCLMLPIERYAVHGVYDRPLRDVFKEAADLWAELPALYSRRTLELQACKACPGRRHCAGGCIGRAWATAADPMTVEDRCALRKSVYTWKEPLRTKKKPATISPTKNMP